MSNSNPSPKERAAHFIAQLRSVRNDRGSLAALRRGLSPSTVVDAWPVVARLGGNIGQPGESVDVDIAALFALHPEESDARNFGVTCRDIAMAASSDRTLPESYERRFRRLLASGDGPDLSRQLRSWVRLAASKGMSVNYESLFADLWNWRWYADDIRVNWARAFWQAGEFTATDSPNKTSNQPVIL